MNNQILSITKDDDYLENPDKQAKVKKLEKEIDQLVYKLYELTPEEIKIVEEFGKWNQKISISWSFARSQNQKVAAYVRIGHEIL